MRIINLYIWYDITKWIIIIDIFFFGWLFKINPQKHYPITDKNFIPFLFSISSIIYKVLYSTVHTPLLLKPQYCFHLYPHIVAIAIFIQYISMFLVDTKLALREQQVHHIVKNIYTSHYFSDTIKRTIL